VAAPIALPSDAGDRLAIGAETGVSIERQRRALVPPHLGTAVTAPAQMQGVPQGASASGVSARVHSVISIFNPV
jgi:hypothetical protein